MWIVTFDFLKIFFHDKGKPNKLNPLIKMLFAGDMNSV